MTAFNIVRFRVKPGFEQKFIDAHKSAEPDFPGMRRFTMVNTAPGAYCVIGEWSSFDALASARPGMLSILDGFRHMLEDLGGGLGVTDPISGSMVLEMGRKATAKPKKKPAKRAAAKKKPAKKKAANKTAKKSKKAARRR